MLSSAFTRCRCRDVDFNAVILTATGREKTTAALVSPSLIAIHVNAKRLACFLCARFFSPVFTNYRWLNFRLEISGFHVVRSTVFFFFDVFRSRISRYCEGVSPQPPRAPAAAVLSETDRRCYKAGSLHDVLQCRSSTAVLQQ